MLRWIIRLIPLEIFILSIIVGWYWVEGIERIARTLPAPPAVAQANSPHNALTLSPIFTPEVQRWSDQIIGWAADYGLDPNLVATVMQIESCGWASAESASGAQGLFQVMPWHFESGETMQDPNTNAARGLAYLALGLERAGGNAGLALAGYNGGHGLIGRDSALWPAETRRYFYWGTGIYDDALRGETNSARLQEWLSAGGASLCATAAKTLGINR